MTEAIHDFKAIRAATLAFPKDRPQNVVSKTEIVLPATTEPMTPAKTERAIDCYANQYQNALQQAQAEYSRNRSQLADLIRHMQTVRLIAE